MASTRHVRCKWYDDSGNAFSGGGCRRRLNNDCPFAHPGEIYWASAVRKQLASDTPQFLSRRDSWGAPPSVPSRAFNSKAPSRPASTSTSKDVWDQSAWRSPASSAGSPSRQKSTEQSVSWGTASTSEWGKGSGWGASSSTDLGNGSSTGTTGGWGDSAGSGWGTGGGWGASSEQEKGSGWGASSSTESGPASSSGTPGGWGDSAGSSGWGTGGGWGASSEQEKSNGRGASSSKESGHASSSGTTGGWGESTSSTSGWAASGSGWGSAARPSDPKGNNKESSPVPPFKTANAQTKLPSNAEEQAPPPPLPSKTATLTQLKNKLSSDSEGNTKASSPVIPLKTPTTQLKRKQNSIGRSISPAEPRIKVPKPTTPAERVELYKTVIKIMQLLVACQVELVEAQADVERWKRTQKSPIYEFSTPKTREALETQQRIYVERVDDLKKRRNTLFQNLLDLPDIPPAFAKKRDFAADRQKIADYTAELKTWFQDLDLPRRLPPAPADSEEVTNLNDEQELTSTTHETPEAATPESQRLKWTWADLNRHLDSLMQRVQNAEGIVYYNLYISDDLEKASQTFREEVKAKKQAAHLRKVAARLDAQNAPLASLDTGIRNMADNSMLDVERKLTGIESHVDLLEQRTQQLTALNDEDEEKLRLLEANRQDQTQRIDLIAEQLRQMALTSPPSSAPPPVRPITIDDIAPEVRQLFVDRLKAEITPVLQGLVEGSKKTSEILKADLEKSLEPIVAKTREICDYAKSLPP